MASAIALKPCILTPVPRATSARAFDASVLIFSREHRSRRTVARQLWPSGWTVASFVLDAAATLWTQTSDGRQVLPILSTVSAGRIAALDVHRVDITADATLRAF